MTTDEMRKLQPSDRVEATRWASYAERRTVAGTVVSTGRYGLTVLWDGEDVGGQYAYDSDAGALRRETAATV